MRLSLITIILGTSEQEIGDVNDVDRRQSLFDGKIRCKQDCHPTLMPSVGDRAPCDGVLREEHEDNEEDTEHWNDGLIEWEFVNTAREEYEDGDTIYGNWHGGTN